MHSRTMPLMGQSKALLRLQEQDGQLLLTLSPAMPGSTLFLIGPQAQAFSVDLDAAGRGQVCLPFALEAALIYTEDGFPLHGGFAGRSELMDRAKVSVRLQAPARKVAPPPVPQPEPAPTPPKQPQPTCPQPRAEVEAGIQPPPRAPSQRQPAPAASNRPQSEVLLEVLQRAQALFHGGGGTQPDKPAPPLPAPEPTAIPNPFPRTFPQSNWRRVNYPGALGHYLCGEGTSRSGAYTVYALPGEYSPVPRSGKGFNKFLRASDGRGYWVRVVRNAPRA